MKFNRSHILLISLISVFLLLGIGAASAASDVEDIAYDMAVDDNSGIEDIDNNLNDIEVLSQAEETTISDEGDASGDGEEGGDEPVDGSINTSVDVNNTDYFFGDDIKINFSVKYNESKDIENITKNNIKVFRNNGTDNESDVANISISNFTISNGQLFINKTLPVGNYTLKIQFLNSTIDGKNYTESEKNITLKIEKTSTTLNATIAKVKLGDEVLIPFKIYIKSGKTLNVNSSRINVTLNGEDIAFTNMTGGDNVTNGIKLTNFENGTGEYRILIKYLGNDNCNPCEANVTLRILENNTMFFYDNVTVNFTNFNITIPISINNTVIVNYTDDEGVNKTNVTVKTLPIEKDNLTLEVRYYNGTENRTKVYQPDDYELNFIEDGKYTIIFAPDVPLNNARLDIIYMNNKTNEARNNITFTVTNSIITNVTSLNVNNHTRNITVPVSVNQTVKVTYDGKNITNVTVLNLTNNITLVVFYDNGTKNATVDNFNLTDENGTYEINATIDGSVSLDNATLTITYAKGNLNETSKNITLKGVIDINITSITAKLDYQNGTFVFKLIDSVDGSPIADTNITVSGLWFYTFGNTTSLSGSKTFTTNSSGFLEIENVNMHPSIDISGYSAGFVALPVGTYNLTFSAKDPFVLNEKVNITVNKVQAEIVASDLSKEFGNSIKYTFEIRNKNTGNPIKVVTGVFRIKGGSLDATRSGPTNLTGWYISPSLNLTANKYTLTLSVNDSNLICSPVTKTLTITKRLATLTASSRTVYYGATDDVVVTVKDKKTGKKLANTYVLMQIYTSAKKTINYAVATNSKGVAKFSPPTALTVGKHKVLLSVLDNNYNSSTITRYVTVKKAPAKFSASNVKTYYRSGKLFKIKLTNTKTKKGLYGAKVNIKVYISKNKFYNYTGVTNAKGYVQFVVNYKPGTYKVVVSSADKGYTAKKITKKIKVTKHPIRFKLTSLKVKKGKYLKVKVISKKTKKVVSGVKVKIRVYTGKKYKTYTKKSNKKGIASLKIKQKVGKHKVVVTAKYPKLYTAKKLTKKIRVKK